MAINIQQADVHDLDVVARLFNQYRMFYGQSDNQPACSHFLFERIINHESIIYLAYCEQQPAGFTQLYPSFSSVSLLPVWILNDLFVVPQYRRKGVAKTLIEHCQQWVVSRKDKGLELSTAADNVSAKALYDACGFVRDTFDHYAWRNVTA